MNNIVEEAEWLAAHFSPETSMIFIIRSTGKTGSWIRTRQRLLALSPEMIDAARRGLLSEKQVVRLTNTVKEVNRQRIFREMIDGTK